jgi:hypothetical protein
LFAYALSVPLLAVITALTLCLVFSHTNSVYGAPHFAVFLMINTPVQKVKSAGNEFESDNVNICTYI